MSSSSSRSGRSSASASGSLTAAPSSSSAFVPPPPAPTTNGGGGGGGFGNGSGSGAGPGPSGPPPNLATSASLYLYTFLATLILLLTVSGAIVIRSFILRRRHRRMIEEAIANGTYIPPSTLQQGLNGKIDLSKKPKMHEAFLSVDDGGHSEGWEHIQPFTAKDTSPSQPPNPSTSSTNLSSHPPPPSRSRTFFNTSRLNPFRRRRNHLSRSTTPTNAIPLTERTTSSDKVAPPSQQQQQQERTMEVAVVIAMPSSDRTPYHLRDEDDDLPVLEIGVVRAVIPPTSTSSPSAGTEDEEPNSKAQGEEGASVVNGNGA